MNNKYDFWDDIAKSTKLILIICVIAAFFTGISGAWGTRRFVSSFSEWFVAGLFFYISCIGGVIPGFIIFHFSEKKFANSGCVFSIIGWFVFGFIFVYLGSLIPGVSDKLDAIISEPPVNY